ncbi:sigma-54-dependent transcriptional regulator [Shewanella nanhaiensis]|uniref:Sigma-54 dependent transcriptional regulator n=1 Tax=Shewanella nanhaiensis TaxID=2864872 RepID=A0ABS7E504_9GAMM|nr:sigma-54 dependent transcriptional regulator [Shewanella nanhaiensis]MBW8184216.1 sigma-54 dependent transcriptional regulator [Shewanella nanhaiensis]
MTTPLVNRSVMLWPESLQTDIDKQLIEGLASIGWQFQTSIFKKSSAASVGLAFIDLASLERSRAVLEKEKHCQWIVITAQEELKQIAKRLSLSNVYDYHHRPVDIDILSAMIGHCIGMQQLNTSEPEVHTEGPTKSLNLLYELACKVAKTDVTLLLQGPSGSGKEYLARYIHKNSARHTGPFVSLNCAGIQATLAQDELFGHEKGAFTGADQQHIGAFEQANGGTLLLDEIGDLPMELQGNFLQVLETRHIKRVGSSVQRPIDTRILAASHRNLFELVQEGHFRLDLYYRLNVITLEVPPLAARQDDILPLARRFLLEFESNHHVSKRLSSDAERQLCLHYWPGNVRELHNVITQAAILVDGDIIYAKDIQFSTPSGSGSSLKEHLERAEAEHIRSVLLAHQGNRNKAALQLGISRHTLYRRIKQLDVNA